MTGESARSRKGARRGEPRWSSGGSTRIALPNSARTDSGSGQRKEMEHRILMAAAHLFNSKGFAGATTRELAQSLGFQRSTLYHYLESKQDLLYALCVASMETAARHFAAAVESAPPELRLRSA